MESKPTNRKLKWAGFTLTELVVATGVGGLIMLCIAALYLFSQRSFVGMYIYADLNDRSRNASDMISRDIRGAAAVLSATNNQIVLGSTDGDISYTYDSSNRTLVRLQNGGSRTLLYGVDSLNFALYQRPLTNATFGNFPTASPANAKMVAFQWSCSRTVPAAKMNSESVRAGIVQLRNQ